MRTALSSIGAALGQASRHWGTLAVANVVVVVLSVPLLLIAALSASALGSATSVALIVILVIGILPNPAACGLQYLAWQLAGGNGLFLSDQWDGLRRFGWLALRAWALSLLGTIAIVANLVFYGRVPSPVGPLVQILWLYVLLVWLSMHLYIYPLLIVQHDKRLHLIYRNAFIMTARRPLLTGVAAAIWLVALLVSIGTGLAIILGFAIAAAIQQNVTAAALPTFTGQQA